MTMLDLKIIAGGPPGPPAVLRRAGARAGAAK
jgi:hypothetical protein